MRTKAIGSKVKLEFFDPSKENYLIYNIKAFIMKSLHNNSAAKMNYTRILICVPPFYYSHLFANRVAKMNDEIFLWANVSSNKKKRIVLLTPLLLLTLPMIKKITD